MIARLLAAFTASCIATSALASPIAIRNPSFEPPVTTGLRVAPAEIGGWDVTDGTAQLFATGSGDFAQHGTQYLFLAGTQVQNVDVEQALSGFVPGVEYVATYWLCGYNLSATPKDCAIEISLFNMKMDAFDYAVPATTTDIGDESNKWIQRTFNFVAPSAAGDLVINVYRSDMLNDAYATFDNISIRPVVKGIPKLKVKIPRSKSSSTSRSRVVLRGKATGTLPIEFIRVQNGKKTTTLVGKNSWRASVRLRPGKNRIKVQAIDIAGTSSRKETRILSRT